MRILLIGEYSRLHNSLKEGLVALGHEVTLLGNGDGFKNYPVDLSTKAKWSESNIGTIFRKIIHKLTTVDIAQLEFGIRCYFHLEQLKDFDVVQLINESPIQTTPILERYLLKKIFSQNPKTFLLCCGVDYNVAKHLIEKKERYSIMNPFFENPNSKKEYDFIINYLSENHIKTHNLVYQNIAGVIASDIDYVLPMQENPKYLGLVANPINTSKIEASEIKIADEIIIFLGINRRTYYTKGITFFEKALEIIQKKYQNKVAIIIAENLPYQEYIQKYNQAHILLDQVYGFDQGYNALEAMAKGKVVFTGAEKEFTDTYHLTEKVALNALPDVDYLVNELSNLIENPKLIQDIGTRARQFVEQEHNYIKIATKYCEKWGSKI